jgi:hypothetical protein
MEWMPIETAPKVEDEDVLLLMGNGARTVGRWDTQPFHTKPRPLWKTERGYLYGKAWDRENQPTHWMALPPPPTQPQGDEP